jgi:hypothetical protein
LSQVPPSQKETWGGLRANHVSKSLQGSLDERNELGAQSELKVVLLGYWEWFRSAK